MACLRPSYNYWHALAKSDLSLIISLKRYARKNLLKRSPTLRLSPKCFVHRLPTTTYMYVGERIGGGGHIYFKPGLIYLAILRSKAKLWGWCKMVIVKDERVDPLDSLEAIIWAIKSAPKGTSHHNTTICTHLYTHPHTHIHTRIHTPLPHETQILWMWTIENGHGFFPATRWWWPQHHRLSSKNY